MESMNQTSGYCYNSDDSEGDMGFSGLLEIFAHHARNIHNICIYDKQDVYAKFSLTYNPDDMVSTKVIIGGGKNPEFNEKLEIKVSQIDAVLKCEIWMLSRAKNLMEDQLLGFALVPISHIVSQGGKVKCQDFSLSSTDLFHSPAGIVQLSLTLCSTNSSVFPLNSSVCSNPSSSIASEVVLLDPNDYSRVQFPDINAATEDQMIISEYLNSNCTRSLGSLLQLGSALITQNDYEMISNSMEENRNSPNNQNSGVFSSTTTSVSDDRNSADSNSVQKSSLYTSCDQPAQSTLEAEAGEMQSHAEEHPRVENHREIIHEIEVGKNTSMNQVVKMDVQGEQEAMQQQIVDMYMKSMHQFTESLAKMKLPMDLNSSSDGERNGNMITISERSNKLEVDSKKKDGSRVFYGSRAFF